ncbi:MAG: serine--tRNA ligase, partial [Acidimicrobiales bacterium]
MIDVRLLRTEPDAVKAALVRKKVDPAEVDRAVELDVRRRDLAGRRDVIRAKVKGISQGVGKARRGGDQATADALAAESRTLGDEERSIDAETGEVEVQLQDLLLRLPNLPSPDAPDGESADDNPVLRIEGHDPDRFGDHQRVPHWDIGAQLGLLDLERGARISGSMFVVYRGMGATLVRALCQLALDRNADAFEEVRPPTLVRTDTLTATGQLPKFAD